MAEITEPEFGSYSFSELQERGVLWAINRLVFHPRGYALAWGEDEHGFDFFNLYANDGSEPIGFLPEDDDSGYHKFESFLGEMRKQRKEGETQKI